MKQNKTLRTFFRLLSSNFSTTKTFLNSSVFQSKSKLSLSVSVIVVVVVVEGRGRGVDSIDGDGVAIVSEICVSTEVVKGMGVSGIDGVVGIDDCCAFRVEFFFAIPSF